MFFRIKKINGKEYCYIVENEWKSKGSRQKVKYYLGRVYRFNVKNNSSFFEYFKIENIQKYIDGNDKNKILKDLIEWELFRFGISNQEFSMNLKNITIKKNKKNIVFLIDDGFMCELTLKNLFNFKFEGDEQIDGYRLARNFVEAGIKVPQEVFIGLFEMLEKNNVV